MTVSPLQDRAETTTAEARRSAPGGDGRSPTRQPYVPSLDGLRALAVGAVLAYHLGYLEGGYLGVDLFFVVSGYLITTLLIAEADRSGRVSLRSFWMRRFRRLMPAVLVVVVAVIAATRLWMPSWRWSTIRGDALATLLYVENWRQIALGDSYFNGASPFRHTWSLSLEEQFYLLWPLAVVAVVAAAKQRMRAGIAVVAGVGAVASAVWMAHLSTGSPDDARLSRLYLGTDTRAMTVLTGVVLAVLVAWLREERHGLAVLGRWRPVAAAVALPALAVGVVMALQASNTDIRMYRGGFVVFALLSASLVLGCVAGVGPLATVLAVRPLRWIGGLSYALYLWSWPVQLFAEDHFGLHDGELVVVVLGLSLVLAVLTTELVERPIRYGGRFRGRWWIGPAAALVCCLLAVAITLGGAAAPDYTKVTDQEATAAALDTDTGTVRTSSAPPIVMVTGDSVAWSMAWRVTDKIPGVQLDLRAVIGCGVMPPGTRWITTVQPEPQPYPAACARLAEADRAGLAGKPDAVVFGVGAWEVYDQDHQGRRLVAGSSAYRKVLVDLLGAKIEEFRKAGAHVIIPLVPCVGDLLPALGQERHDEAKRAWFNGILRDLAAQHADGVSIVDPTPLVCGPDGAAIADVDGVASGIPRPDGIHYDPAGRFWLWRTLLTPAVHEAVGEFHRVG